MGGILTRPFSRDSRMTIMVIVVGITFVCELMSYIIQIIVLKMQIDILPFIKIVGIEMLYNMVIVIMIYPLLQKSGRLIEQIYTEDKTLTRYF